MPKAAVPWGENGNSANEKFHSLPIEPIGLRTIRAERDRIPFLIQPISCERFEQSLQSLKHKKAHRYLSSRTVPTNLLDSSRRQTH